MKKKHKIAILSGDGIGPEIMQEAYKIIEILKKKFNLPIETSEYDVGGIAIDKHNNALPENTLNGCKNSDSILFGAVGGDKWNHMPIEKRPEIAGLLNLRKKFNLFANIRPCNLNKKLHYLSPLKSEISKKGFNLICIRELTGGIYFGKSKYDQKKKYAYDTEIYSEYEIQRIAKIAFQIAQKRTKKLVSIDKANVLKSSALWRSVVDKMSKDYSDIQLTHMYIDNATMELIKKPFTFDTVLCSNLFGDILSDECAALSGSIGMLPSASINEYNFGLYEPAGGSAPNITGKNIANPIAQILSLSMLVNYSMNLPNIASLIEESVSETLYNNNLTLDLVQKNKNYISTSEMGNKISEQLLKKV
ncbi:3-isopropylmalate dehydrogenase (plasmid) [Buchnera aphidicola (Thelaxes californica)]|uniref:3-isopropylmalate dehydrogenase n=1 Tax=Buchnera aphidicola (Thelaxes californica) TaxID=1315998 RepID=A0A4D6YMK8_9GAMM|nr:3-isopropylmalate dehydrogenase [Buchnera aphidicola]QCI27008.1 3-isopropylmalate dehydrogenase [Buchnera aphidicola (Thelaxes californica)]